MKGLTWAPAIKEKIISDYLSTGDSYKVIAERNNLPEGSTRDILYSILTKPTNTAPMTGMMLSDDPLLKIIRLNQIKYPYYTIAQHREIIYNFFNKIS